MARPMVYMTAPATRRAPEPTVHLADAEVAHQGWALGLVVELLCGRVASLSDWDMGDETLGGIAATCGTCRKAAGRPKEN